MLAVQLAERGSFRGQEEHGSEGIRVLPELCHVLRQARARQLLPAGRGRTGEGRRAVRLPPDPASARRRDGRRRSVDHGHERVQEVRCRSEGSVPGNRILQEHRRNERAIASPAAYGRRAHVCRSGFDRIGNRRSDRRRTPHSDDPLGRAAEELRLGVDRQGRRVPPRW